MEHGCERLGVGEPMVAADLVQGRRRADDEVPFCDSEELVRASNLPTRGDADRA